jgi:hypothetical protein
MLQPRAAGYGALSDAVPGHLAHPAGLPETLARTLPPAIRARSCEVVDLRAKGAAQPADASAVEPHVRHAAQHHRYAVQHVRAARPGVFLAVWHRRRGLEPHETPVGQHEADGLVRAYGEASAVASWAQPQLQV